MHTCSINTSVAMVTWLPTDRGRVRMHPYSTHTSVGNGYIAADRKAYTLCIPFSSFKFIDYLYTCHISRGYVLSKSTEHFKVIMYLARQLYTRYKMQHSFS